MTESADVVIVGAGVVGCSIAYNLAKRGCTHVTVLEKGSIGSGSTGKCAGGIRQQFSSEANILLSKESVRFYENFEDNTGCPADFRQKGYLFLSASLEEDEQFKSNVSLQRKLGVKAFHLSPSDVKEMVPLVNTDDVVGATFCQTDGFADPYSVVQGFASAARRHGARIYEETEVIGLRMDGRRISRALTTKGEISASVVVNAAGPYSALVGNMLKLQIPVFPHRRHIFVTERTERVSAEMPLVIDFDTGFWFRREGPCVIFGMRNQAEKQGFDTSTDWAFLSTIAGVALNRAPVFESLGVARGQAGLHEDTPDANPVLGGVPEIDNLFLACGFSGHGFMQAPAVGRIMSEIIMGAKATTPDVTPFALSRFGSANPSIEKVFI